MAKIGEILIQKGFITPQDLEQAMVESKNKGEVLGKTLVRLNFITQAQFLEALSEQLGMTYYASLADVPISRDAIEAVPVKFVWHYKIMPIEMLGKVLTVAVSDPLTIWSIEDLKLQLGCEIQRVLATEDEILDTIRKYYGFGAETVEEILSQNVVEKKEETKHEEVEEIEKSAEDTSVIKLVNENK